MNYSSSTTSTDDILPGLSAGFTTSWYDLIFAASPVLFSLIALWFLTEQITYLKRKSILPGPTFILPFLGTAGSLVLRPTKYWEDQNSYAKRTPLGVSANYFFGRFMVFIRDSDLSHKIFANVRPDAFNLIGHPFGKKLFGEHNLIYMTGQEHKDIRRRIAPNFTPRALSTYAKIQQSIILKHLKLWDQLSNNNPTAAKDDGSSSPNPIALRILSRDLNLETSQTVFAGTYLTQEARQRFNADYNLFNVGLMKLPVDLPGFAFRSARLAVTRLAHTLSACAEQSKARMAAGVVEPTCLIDFWMQDSLREEKEASLAGVEPSPPLPTTDQVGGHLFDFLFAAQDASTSSLLWAITYLDAHQDVLAKVREEVAGIWSPESGEFISAEQLVAMKYTQAVAREILRIRAPATLVPHIAARDYPLTDGYTIPKGALVFPSVMESSFQGFPDPERFDPDRFLEGREEDKLYKRNFLVFGAGAHQCVGQRYATNHLVLFIAMFTSMLDFKRHNTDGCDDIVYNPTICPKDDCTVYLTRRVAAYPSLLLRSSSSSS